MKVVVDNFASYKHLEFDFSGQGLTLIHGATGSGKSTLCDIIPWILFGRTAKGGKADEVLSWNGGVTKGTIFLGRIEIVRTRGKAKDNDLYFRELCGYQFSSNLVERRGKDAIDTQKLINEKLGLTPDIYLAGAYFHEFSQTAQFFTTTPKNRRSICEQLVDLKLAKTLQDKNSESKRSIQDQIVEVSNLKVKHEMGRSSSKTTLSDLKVRSKSWDKEQVELKKDVKQKHKDFESGKLAQIHQISLTIQPESVVKIRQQQLFDENVALTGTCPTCGSPTNHTRRREIQQESHKLEMTLEANKFAEYRIASLQAQEYVQPQPQANPFVDTLAALEEKLGAENERIELIEVRLNDLFQQKTDIEVLQDLLPVFRSRLLESMISQVEDKTNELVSDFFDAEFRVEFSLEDSDKLEVLVWKDGNQASFTQLSKGQRQILKLCFSTAVMEAVRNQHALDILFFDESLDGMDDACKKKALRLFTSLATKAESVFLVEHSSDVKAFVDNRFLVTMEAGSEVTQA